MDNQCVLRTANTADAPAIHEVETVCFPDAWRLSSIAETLRDEKSIALVARQGIEIVGYILAWVISGEGEITRVGVVPQWRRHGLGGRLLEALVQESRLRQTERLYLEVRENNTAARQLYEKYGFEVVGSRRNYYANGENAIVMCRKLEIVE